MLLPAASPNYYLIPPPLYVSAEKAQFRYCNVSADFNSEKTGDYMKFNQKESHCVAKRNQFLMLPVTRMLSFGTASCLLMAVRVEPQKT